MFNRTIDARAECILPALEDSKVPTNDDDSLYDAL